MFLFFNVEPASKDSYLNIAANQNTLKTNNTK